MCFPNKSKENFKMFLSACMTKTGKQCIFPFTYKNETSPVLEYNVCSTLDIYRPWCPTSKVPMIVTF